MCVYNKKNTCIYVCVWGCLDKYISVATWPPKQKFLAPPLTIIFMHLQELAPNDFPISHTEKSDTEKAVKVSSSIPNLFIYCIKQHVKIKCRC